MLLIRTNHPHDAAAPDDLAFVANPFHGRSNFHDPSLTFSTIRPRVTSAGIISTRTRSPTSTRMKLRVIRSAICATTCGPSSSRTRYSALGSCAITVPVTVEREPELLAPSESTAHPPLPPPCARNAPTGCRRASPRSSRRRAPSPPACPH